MYQVAVGPGLVVEAPALFEVNAVFGTNPAPVEFPVTLPVGSLGLEASAACRSDYADPAYTDDYTCGPLVHETVTGTVTAIRFDPAPYRPGTYTSTVHVVATYDVGLGIQTHTRDFTVRYVMDGTSGPDLVMVQRQSYADPIRYFATRGGVRARDLGHVPQGSARRRVSAVRLRHEVPPRLIRIGLWDHIS